MCIKHRHKSKYELVKTKALQTSHLLEVFLFFVFDNDIFQLK